MKTSYIRNHPDLPNLIKDHPIFYKHDKINKIFPFIGLSNCSLLLNKTNYYKTLGPIIKNQIKEEFSSLKKYNSLCCFRFGALEVIRKINSIIDKCSPKSFIDKNYKLLTPDLIKDQFKVKTINGLYDKILTNVPIYIETNDYTGRIFSNYAKIVFSSNKEQGIWDIATMSMRGIYSCQSWYSDYFGNLVGSIIDPFVGIIYITKGGNTTYGSKMSYRALVRFVVNNKTGRPALLLESIYSEDNDEEENPYAKHMFVSFLRQKTNNKFPVILNNNGHHIPKSKIVTDLTSCGRYSKAKGFCESYRDSDISYSKSFSKNRKLLPYIR